MVPSPDRRRLDGLATLRASVLETVHDTCHEPPLSNLPNRLTTMSYVMPDLVILAPLETFWQGAP